jgi:hypothetical protein
MSHLALSLLVLAAAEVAAAPAPRCGGGRWVVVRGAPAVLGSAIAIDAGRRVSIDLVCPPTAARRSRRGAILRARWAACAGLGRVALRAAVVDDCARLAGTLRVGRSRRSFEAWRSVCGDGVVQMGEECDGPSGCESGCDADCRCPPPTATTATSTSTTATSATTTTTTTTTPAALPGLPADVVGYRSWLRLNRDPIPVHPESDAHYGTKHVYVNQPRDALAPGGTQRLPYPDGTIVVKESVRPGRGFVGLVSIMRKRAGSDPEHGDWSWVELGRDDAGEALATVGRDVICWSCHVRIARKDWVFTPLD